MRVAVWRRSGPFERSRAASSHDGVTRVTDRDRVVACVSWRVNTTSRDDARRRRRAHLLIIGSNRDWYTNAAGCMTTPMNS